MRSDSGRRRSRMGTLAILLAGLLASGAVEAAVWQERSPHGPADTALLNAPLARYRALTANLGQLHALLAAAPSAHGATAPPRLEFPMPDSTPGAQYIAFDRHEIGASAEPFRCGVDGFTAADAAPITSMPQTSTGATIRTYRLALAATAEYTAYFGGTVADGLAAVVQAGNSGSGRHLNRVEVRF